MTGSDTPLPPSSGAPTPPQIPTIVVQAPAPAGKAGFWAAALMLFLLLGSGAVNFILLIALAASSGDMAQGPDRLIEKTIEPSASASTQKIAVLEVDGLITDSSSVSLLGGPSKSTVDKVRIFLRQAARDKNVKGILLEIDSPGGGVTASDLIYREILQFREENPEVPVVALMKDLAASGGYYIAAACDHILAHETTITGSIGVILSFFDLSEASERYGVREVVIKSGPNKNLGDPFEKMTAEQEAILQAMIDAMYERFVSIVDAGRPNLTADQIRPLADGRIYTGRQAVDNGLVDGIGYFDDAIAKIEDLAGISDPRIVTYRGEPTLADVLSGNVRQPAVPPRVEVDVDVLGLDLRGTPRFQYLWRVR